MGDVNSFDPPWHFIQLQNFLQTCESFLGVDVEHFRLSVVFKVASKVQSSQGLDVISNAGRLFELKCLRRRQHVLLHVL